MKKSIIGMVILLFSQGIFAMQVDDDVKEELTESIKISVNNYSEKKEKTILVDKKLLAKAVYFENFFLEEKLVELEFGSMAQAHAFEKIILFIQNNDVFKEETFLQKADFVELVAFAFKCDISSLGDMIVEFIKTENRHKINASKTQILDYLTEYQIENLCQVFSANTGQIEGWFDKAQKELAFYFHLIHLERDPRIAHLGLTFNANLFALATAARVDAIQNNKRLQAEMVAKQNIEARVSQICAAIVRNETRRSCYGWHKGTLNPGRHSSLVSGSSAHAINDALKLRLHAYNVFLNTDDWQPKSQLFSNERWPRTLGGCCASICGLSACIFTCPVQCCLCFCHKQCCPDSCTNCFDDHDVPNTQVASAVRHCVYKCATCFYRWIIIEPKDFFGESTPVICPPREEML